MPRAAHDDDPAGAVLEDGAQHLPHVRLALLLPVALGTLRGRDRLPQHGHGLGDGRERAERRVRLVALGVRRRRLRGKGAPGLDDVVPPPLGVVVPGGVREEGDRVRPGLRAQRLAAAVRGRLTARVTVRVALRPGAAVRLPLRERHRGGQVAQLDPDAVAQGVRDRLPLRGEHRERPERRGAGSVGGVAEQGDRRGHVRRRREREHRVGVRGTLDEHAVGRQRLERGGHRPGRARPVVPHAEHLDPRLGHRHPDTSRQAR